VDQDKSVESAVFVVSDSEHFKMAEQEPPSFTADQGKWNQIVYVAILLT
jgi:hypothetical protein